MTNVTTAKNELIDKVKVVERSDEWNIKFARIEFQGRGTPHCHILIGIKGSTNTPSRVDPKNRSIDCY